MMMDAREDGELSGSGAEEEGEVVDTDLKKIATQGTAPAAAAAGVVDAAAGPQFQYRRGGSAAVLASSDEDDHSSDGDSEEDDNCHLKAPTKRRKMHSASNSQRMEAPAGWPLPTAAEASAAPALKPLALVQPPLASLPSADESTKPKKKKNNIWANVLGEQSLMQDIGSVGLKRLEGDRSVENYDFRAAQALRALEEVEEEDGEELEEGEMKEHTEEPEEDKETPAMMAKRLGRKRPMSHRTYRPPPPPCPSAAPGEPLQLADLDVTDQSTDQQVAAAMAKALQENKPDIISRVVEVLGRNAALKLYADTCKVELEGGLLIMNGERRRTSGGVYLQLLKQEQLSKEQTAAIFPPDEAQLQWRRRRRAVHRRRNRDRQGDGDRQGGSEGSGGDAGGSAGSRSNSSAAAGVGDGDRCPRLPLMEDSNDAHDLAGSQCPGSTPVTSPLPSPGPTPTTTPIVTPHCSDAEEDERGGSSRLVDTALAIVKAVSPGVAPLALDDEDFVDVSGQAPDQMDVL